MPQELKAFNPSMEDRLFDLIKQGASVRQLQIVLESKRNLEGRNDRQETPIMSAMLNIHDPMKRKETLFLFIEYQANINCFNNRGQTPLMYASILNQTSELRILLNEPGLECNLQDFEGNTALMYACALGKTAAIETLVEAHCAGQIQLNPHIMNFEGTSAFDYARDNPDNSMVKLLGRLLTENSVYHYDQGLQDAHHTGKQRPSSRIKKDKDTQAMRIQQLAGDVKIAKVPVTEICDESQDISESKKVSKKPSKSKNKIPTKKSFIVHLPRTYNDDDDDMTHVPNNGSITDRPSMSQNSKIVIDDQMPSTSGLPSTSGRYSRSDIPVISGFAPVPSKQTADYPSTPDFPPSSELPSTSEYPSTSEMPSTSGVACQPHPPDSSHPKGKQRKNRKGKRTRKKKRVQTMDVQTYDLGITCSKPKDFGEEIAFGNKIYGTDLYPCSSGPDDCYANVDKVMENIRLKISDYIRPSLNDKERTMKSKVTGKMDCMQLSATERAKLLSRTIWSVYGAPLPPIPISLSTVHRVMSGITRLRQYLGKAKYQPGRLLNLDPEMWCIVESIKHELGLHEQTVFGM